LAQITTPPASLGLDPVFTKYLNCYGLPLVSTSAVDDEALLRTRDSTQAVLQRLASDPELQPLLGAYLAGGEWLVVLGRDELAAEVLGSEFTGASRSFSGNPMVVAEESVLDLADPWYSSFCTPVWVVSVSLFKHAMSAPGSEPVGPDYAERLQSAYDAALAGGLYTESAFDLENVGQFLGGQSARWFNCNPTDLAVADAVALTDREQLAVYDPVTYALLSELYEPASPWAY